MSERVRSSLWFVGAVVSVLGLAWLFQGERVPRADVAIANGADPKSLDPARVSGTVEGRILRALFEGLTTADPRTLEPRPGMAERWEVRRGGREHVFHLRDDARWTNGDPVTAHDFEWSWRRLLAPETGGQYAELLWTVVGARAFHEGQAPWETVAIAATDAATLVVRHEHPVPYFVQLTAFFPLFPVHPGSVAAADDAGVGFTTPERLVTNGPFRLGWRRLRDRIRVLRNPGYWDADGVVIDTLDFLAVESSNTQLNLFLSGEADWVAEVPRSVVPTLANDPAYARVYRPTPYLATYFYRVNVTRPPFDEREIRHALSLAADRAEIVESVTRAGEEVAWSFVPWPRRALSQRAEQRGEVVDASAVPFGWYSRALCAPTTRVADDSYPWRSLGHDPAAARATLARHGYRVPREGGGFTAGKEFPETEILYNSSPLHERIAEVIQAQWWRELGIRVRLTNQEWGSYLSAQQTLDYDVSRSMWIGDYLDPDTFLGVFISGGPNNRTGWANAEYDELLGRARQCEVQGERARLLQRAEEVLMRELPLIPLFYCVTEGLVSEGVGGIEGNPLNTLFPRHLVRKGKRQ